ncbi:hypothetical protein [Thiococcus pfennigii]|uniref:hypothetical protein n=1 Tax=Thiococcus pfennigii TaxID=1057 RepID=UPI0019082BFB|nr:hypothetical protein [Thiococcus pfennigii]MBK1699770.1 hypothetical protein [Thiococcus pfennigii]
MDLRTLLELNKESRITSAVLYRPRDSGGGQWEIWVYGDLPPDAGNRVNLSQGARLVFDSADEARAWLECVAEYDGPIDEDPAPPGVVMLPGSSDYWRDAIAESAARIDAAREIADRRRARPDPDPAPRDAARPDQQLLARVEASEDPMDPEACLDPWTSFALLRRCMPAQQSLSGNHEEETE